MLRRLYRALRFRIHRHTRILILGAGPLLEPPSVPQGLRLLCVSAQDRREVALAVQAMRRADEEDVVAERLDHGDRFFGWVSGEAVVSFGWACDRDRVIGMRRYPEAPGRIFLYNFHTLPAHRGRGLYPALLRHIRHQFGRAGYSELVIDVREDNVRSRGGIEKAGFRPIGSIAFATWFGLFSVEIRGWQETAHTSSAP